MLATSRPNESSGRRFQNSDSKPWDPSENERVRLPQSRGRDAPGRKIGVAQEAPRPLGRYLAGWLAETSRWTGWARRPCTRIKGQGPPAAACGLQT